MHADERTVVAHDAPLMKVLIYEKRIGALHSRDEAAP
jgi:hypothetical protein